MCPSSVGRLFLHSFFGGQLECPAKGKMKCLGGDKLEVFLEVRQEIARGSSTECAEGGVQIFIEVSYDYTGKGIP